MSAMWMTKSWATEVRSYPWPQCDSAYGNYVQGMHAYNDSTCQACQLVGRRQMHNYIYIYSAAYNWRNANDFMHAVNLRCSASG